MSAQAAVRNGRGVATGLPPVRVLHLVSHPIQYFAPLYRELADRPEIDLTVCFYSVASLGEYYDEGFGRPVRWDADLLDGYRSKIPASARSRPVGPSSLRPGWDVVREAASRSYDVVWAHGYAHLTTWLALGAARATGKAALLRDEQTLLHVRSGPKALLKTLALRALYSQAGALAIGEANRRHVLRFGARPERVFFAPYCVDNEALQARARELAPERDALRRSFGIADGAPVVLFAGKLVEKKQPLRLLEAFAAVRERRPAWLLLAGDGPLRAEVEERIARDAIPGVVLAGFLNQSELPAAYAAADVFALPSSLHETWGLVVNEALNFGLPAVVTDRVGCAPDLVRDGETGYVVRHDDVDALAAALDALVADEGLRRRLGENGRALVARYGIDACADGIVAACLASAPQRRAREAVAA